MKIVVKNIYSHVARPCNSEYCVHVGSVTVNQSASIMHDFGYLHDITFKNAKSVRIGQHYSCNFVIKHSLETVNTDFSRFIAFKDYYIKTVKGAACRICSVCTVGNYYFFSFCVAFFLEITSYDPKADILSVSSGRRVKRCCGKPSDLTEHFLHFIHQFQRSLRIFDRCFRMKICKSGNAGHFFIYLGIIFHCTASKRIKTKIDAEIIS